MVWGLGGGSYFCLLFHHYLLKKLFLLHYISFSLSKISWPYLCGTICGFFSGPVTFICPFPVTIQSWLVSYIVNLETGESGSSHFIFLFQNYFIYSSSYSWQLIVLRGFWGFVLFIESCFLLHRLSWHLHTEGILSPFGYISYAFNFFFFFCLIAQWRNLVWNRI